MTAPEFQLNANTTHTALGRNSTAEEATRLRQLREKMAAQAPVYLSGGLDERRVEFARWLIQSGRLSDDC